MGLWRAQALRRHDPRASATYARSAQRWRAHPLSCESAGLLRVPPVVTNKARLAGAWAWLDELPQLIGSLSESWAITVGDTHDDATKAFVAAATMAHGTSAVLKLIVPRAGGAAANEI